MLCGIPEEAPCGLQQLPDAHQLPLHILQLKQVAEDELVLSHGLLTDHNTQWPFNLQIMTCVALQQAVSASIMGVLLRSFVVYANAIAALAA